MSLKYFHRNKKENIVDRVIMWCHISVEITGSNWLKIQTNMCVLERFLD